MSVPICMLWEVGLGCEVDRTAEAEVAEMGTKFTQTDNDKSYPC